MPEEAVAASHQGALSVAPVSGDSGWQSALLWPAKVLYKPPSRKRGGLQNSKKPSECSAQPGWLAASVPGEGIHDTPSKGNPQAWKSSPGWTGCLRTGVQIGSLVPQGLPSTTWNDPIALPCVTPKQTLYQSLFYSWPTVPILPPLGLLLSSFFS